MGIFDSRKDRERREEILSTRTGFINSVITGISGWLRPQSLESILTKFFDPQSSGGGAPGNPVIPPEEPPSGDSVGQSIGLLLILTKAA